MSILEAWAAKGAVLDLPRAAMVWLVCGALGCTSWAGLGDRQSEPEDDGRLSGNPGSSGAGSARPAPGTPSPAAGSPRGGDAVGAGGTRVGAADGERLGIGTEVDSPGNDVVPPRDVPLTPDAGSPAPPGAGLEDPACMGLALSLDGTNYASIPRAIEDDFTIEAWIETLTSRDGVSGFYGRMLFDADIVGSGNYDDFAVTVLNGGVAFAVGNPDITAQGITPVATGRWTHVAVTRLRGSGQLQVLVDGVLDAIVTAPNRNALSATMTLGLGGSAALVRNFVGSIDELKIWNVVRSVDEIASDMRARPDGTEAGLVGYYSFDDAGAEQTADTSPRGLAATLTGAPSYVASSALCLR